MMKHVHMRNSRRVSSKKTHSEHWAMTNVIQLAYNYCFDSSGEIGIMLVSPFIKRGKSKVNVRDGNQTEPEPNEPN